MIAPSNPTTTNNMLLLHVPLPIEGKQPDIILASGNPNCDVQEASTLLEPDNPTCHMAKVHVAKFAESFDDWHISASSWKIASSLEVALMAKVPES